MAGGRYIRRHLKRETSVLLGTMVLVDGDDVGLDIRPKNTSKRWTQVYSTKVADSHTTAAELPVQFEPDKSMDFDVLPPPKRINVKAR